MLEIQDWGLVDYHEAWARQRQLVDFVQNNPGRNVFVVCQHPTVITIGKNGKGDNLLVSRDYLKALDINVIEINRGGDVTLHNPGQIVGYPIFNLVNYRQDLHWFLREVESCIIELLAQYGIRGGRVEGLTGVWIDKIRKICAIGMHCSRWVISHGFALNVSNNLNDFNYIIPCGISGKGICSVQSELGTEIEYSKMKNDCIETFRQRFG